MACRDELMGEGHRSGGDAEASGKVSGYDFSFAEGGLSRFDELVGMLQAGTIHGSKLLSLHLIILRKERFHFIQHARIDLLQAFDVPMQLGVRRNPDEPIILDPFLAILGLLRLNDADDAGPDDTARGGGVIQQEEDVQGYSVIALRGRDKTEIVRKNNATGKHLPQLESSKSLVIGVFVAAAFGVSTTVIASPLSGSNVGMFSNDFIAVIVNSPTAARVARMGENSARTDI